MATSTLGRDFDINRSLIDHRQRISALERRIIRLQEIVPDTGQVSLTGDLNAGLSSANFEVSRVGETVFLQGSVAPNVNWGAVMASTNLMANLLAVQFRPTQSHIVIAGSSATGAMVNFRLSIQNNGQIAVRCDTLNHTGSVFIDHTYRGT